ncbi:hypothetical protein BGW80DRAFT_1173774 [Lactifluus volemus]|nr:hypothetical protein BGW80DRAFT_1173774 [Lactifluus volemus]
MFFSIVAFALYLEAFALATLATVLYEGRVSNNFTEADINTSNGPFLSIVKGSKSASEYFQLLGTSLVPTPLWDVPDQPILVLIDNSSIFTPGSSNPQLGFRRSELIAQPSQNGNRTAFDATIESGVTAFHFSVQADTTQPLNNTHEYQPVFIEPADGTHIFDLQTGTPFNTTLTNAAAASTLRIRTHNRTVLFETPLVPSAWHNFAVVVDWDNLTLQVFHSLNGDFLAAVTSVEDNSSVGKGPAAQGDFHFGLLKLPLISASNTPAEQADVAHFGIQEGTREALIYSGIFVEDTKNGVSVGCTAKNAVFV